MVLDHRSGVMTSARLFSVMSLYTGRKFALLVFH
jgi:hypothetical protein